MKLKIVGFGRKGKSATTSKEYIRLSLLIKPFKRIKSEDLKSKLYLFKAKEDKDFDFVLMAPLE